MYQHTSITSPNAQILQFCSKRSRTWKNSHYVSVDFCLWAVNLTRMARKWPRFGAGIVWGTIPKGFPVSWIAVPGWSRNGFGTSPNLWVQKKLVKLWQGTQDTWLRFAKFFREFFSYSPFDLLGDLGDEILSQFRVKYILLLVFSGVFLETAANFLMFLKVERHETRWKILSVVKTENNFIFDY